MALLKVKYKDRVVSAIPLSEGKTYIGGRKEDADIHLQNEKGVSREHFKIFFEHDQWNLKVLSKFGDVYYRNEKIQEAVLENSSSFQVSLYTFEFSNESASSAFINSEPGDRTVIVGTTPSIPYIKIVDAQGQPSSMIRLEGGNVWLAGRDTNSQIHINDNRVSRKQFEIKKDEAGFLICDLGSVNGTYINGNLLKPNESVLLKSGDAITVLDNQLYFELHDPHYKSRLELVQSTQSFSTYGNTGETPVQPFMQDSSETPLITPHIPLGSARATTGKAKFDFKKQRPKLIVATVLIVLLAIYFSDSDPQSQQRNPGKAVDPFSTLPPEKQLLVKQSYQLAKNYYMQGRYESAKGEIAKLKEFVPEYLDSDKIEKLAEEAIFIQRETTKNENLEKERMDREQKIKERTDFCMKELNPQISAAQVDQCLSDVIQLDPNHPAIQAVKNKLDQIMAEKAATEAQKKVMRGLVLQLQRMYKKAEEAENNDGPVEAIEAFQKVADSRLPDPGGLKPKAEKAVVRLRKEMGIKSDQYMADADRFVSEKKLKEAILSLRKAQKVNPVDSSIADRIEQYSNDLKKQMMMLYQEGILEENFGNVDGGENKAGAREKWRKILELDIPEGEYYKKATLKLKKYGEL